MDHKELDPHQAVDFIIRNAKHLPEALRLADALEDTDGAQDHDEAAAELRRLHEVNQILVEANGMALEALDCLPWQASPIAVEATKALRTALAQQGKECLYPECETGIGCDGPCGEKPVDTVKQEPVAWRNKVFVGDTKYIWNYTESKVQDQNGNDLVRYEPLYAKSQEPVEDEEILDVLIRSRAAISAIRTDAGHPIKGSILMADTNEYLIDVLDKTIEKALKKS